jgi:hypothetical protein
MLEKRNAHRIFVVKPEEMRPDGSPALRMGTEVME